MRINERLTRLTRFTRSAATVVSRVDKGLPRAEGEEDQPRNRRGIRRGAALTVALIVSLLSFPAVGHAQVEQVRYRIAVKKTLTSSYQFHDAVMGVPAPVDVNGDTVPDITVLYAAVVLRIERLPAAPGSPDPLRNVQIEIVAAVPGSTTRSFTFGYDTASSTAPGLFEADVTVGPTSKQLGMSVRTAGAGPSLGLVGSVFDGTYTAPPANWANSISGRLAYTPVPAQMAFTFAQPADNQSLVTATTSTSSVGNLAITRKSESFGVETVSTVTATIKNLPSTLSLTLTESGKDTVVNYRASAPINEINAFYQRRSGAASSLSQGRLQLTGVPMWIDVAYAGSHVLVQAPNGPIGSVSAAYGRAQVATLPTPDPSFPAEFSHVHNATTGADHTTLRLAGLRRAAVQLNDPVQLQLEAASAALKAQVLRGAIDLDGTLKNLPSSVTVTYSPVSKTVSYRASASIAELNLNLRHANGFFRDAKTLNVNVQGIPSSLDAKFEQIIVEGNPTPRITFDTGGSSISKVDATLTNGLGNPLIEESLFATTNDNRVLFGEHAGTGRLLIRARVLGLQRVVLERTDAATLQQLIATVGVTSAAPFRADVVRTAIVGSRGARVTMSRLSPQTTITYRNFTDGGNGKKRTTVSYEATGGVRPSLTIDTFDATSRWNVRVPSLPAKLNICIDGGVANCAKDLPGDALTPKDGDISVRATDPMSVVIDGCTKTSDCYYGSRPRNIVTADIRSVRQLDFAFKAPSGLDESGYFFFDTEPALDPDGIFVNAKAYTSSGNGVRITLPQGFRANNRYIEGDIDVDVDLSLDFEVRKSSGSAICPSGTKAFIDIDDWWDIRLHNDLCTSSP